MAQRIIINLVSGEVLVEAGQLPPVPVGVSPTAIAGGATFPPPTVTAGEATVFPTEFAGVATFPPVTVTADVTVMAVAIAGAATMPTPTINISSSVTATAFAPTVTFNVPAVNQHATVPVGAFTGTVTFPAPAVSATTTAVYPPVFVATLHMAQITQINTHHYTWVFVGDSTFPTPQVTALVSGAVGVPTGPYYYGDGYTSEMDDWNGLWRAAVSGSTLLADLVAARARGTQAIFSMAGGSANYGYPGAFNLNAWKARIDLIAATNVSSYIADGTLWANMLIDEPKAQGSWYPDLVANDVLDEMARYSKTKWPTLPTLVRADAPNLITEATADGNPWPGGDYVWQYLDGTINQYRANEGAIGGWCDDIESSSALQDLSFVMSLQAITGGDGSSGVQVQGRPQYVMSPTEVTTYGTRMLGEALTSGLLIWRYFAAVDCSECEAYWTTTEMQTAHTTLRSLAAAHPQVPLFKRSL